MVKQIGSLIFGAILSSTAIACEISPTIKNQFCLIPNGLPEGHQATVVMPGTQPSDFQTKVVLGALKVSYKGKITENKKGKVVIKNGKGDVVGERVITLTTKDYAAGYDKIGKGALTLLKELRN